MPNRQPGDRLRLCDDSDLLKRIGIDVPPGSPGQLVKVLGPGDMHSRDFQFIIKLDTFQYQLYVRGEHVVFETNQGSAGEEFSGSSSLPYDDIWD